MTTIRWRLDRRDQAKELLRSAAKEGLHEGAEDVLALSNERVPHQEGILEDSGAVSPSTPSSIGDELIVSISYDTPYAVKQHEDEGLRHPNGRQSKYLESALNERGPRALRHAAERMRRRLS